MKIMMHAQFMGFSRGFNEMMLLRAWPRSWHSFSNTVISLPAVRIYGSKYFVKKKKILTCACCMLSGFSGVQLFVTYGSLPGSSVGANRHKSSHEALFFFSPPSGHHRYLYPPS